MSTIEEKILELRDRPQLILGEATIERLRLYLFGYEDAKRDNGLDVTQDEKFMENFQKYVKEYYNQEEAALSWVSIIIKHNSGKDDKIILELFYKLFDQFRKDRKDF